MGQKTISLLVQYLMGFHHHFFYPQTDFVQCLGHSPLAMHDSGQKRPTLNLSGSEMFEIETGTHDVVFGHVLHDAPCNSIDRCV